MEAVNNGLRAQNDLAAAAGWEAPLCAMPGANTCLYTHCCWPCAAGDIAVRTGGSYFVDAICGGVLGCCFCFYCLPWSITRMRLRAQHGIDGTLAEDCLVTLCLPPCYLAQALDHLNARDAARSAAAAARATAPIPAGFVSPAPGVNYAPPPAAATFLPPPPLPPPQQHSM